MRRHLALAGLLMLLLAACDLLPKPGVKTFQKKMVIDAERGFTITLPLDWTKRTVSLRHPWQARLVRWEAPATDAGPIRVDVAVFEPHEVVGGFDRLEALLLAAAPETVLTSRSDLAEAPHPSRRLTGYTPAATLEILLVTARSGAFILVWSAPPERFEETAPARREVLDSFRPLPPT